MNIIMKYELKKIMGRKITIVAIVFLLIFSIIIPITMTIGKRWLIEYDKATDVSVNANNLASIPYKRKAQHSEKGYLTAERFGEVIAKYNALAGDPKNVVHSQSEDTMGNIMDVEYLNSSAYLQMQSVDDILTEFGYAAAPNGDGYSARTDHSPEDGAKYYDLRTKMLNKMLNDPGNQYTQKEKDIINKTDSEIKKPFYYDYRDGWDTLITNFSGFVPLLIIICLICLAPIFSGEYQSGEDSILLTTKHGRGKLAKIKVGTGFLFATILYFGATLLNFIVTMLIYGVPGYNCPVQLYQFLSGYNMNYLQAYLVWIALGYVAMLLIVSLVMLISAWFKTSFTTIILAAALFVAPIFIHSNSTRLINYVATIFPINVTNASDLLRSHILFNIFGTYVPAIPVYFVVLLVLTVLCVPLAIMGFRKHQVA